MSYFVITSAAGPMRDLRAGSREQPWWNEHAAFIDALVEAGFIRLGGPFEDGGAMLVVEAENEAIVLDRLLADPWYEHGILELSSIRSWQLFINELTR